MKCKYKHQNYTRPLEATIIINSNLTINFKYITRQDLKYNNNTNNVVIYEVKYNTMLHMTLIYTTLANIIKLDCDFQLNEIMI